MEESVGKPFASMHIIRIWTWI